MSIANAILQGEISPYEGARELWRFDLELEPLVESLRDFVGLASEWEDDAAHREAYEQEIVRVADRFRARFGR